MKYHTDTPYKSDIEVDGKVLARVMKEHPVDMFKMSRIPRRASRNLSWWQRFKRWWFRLWHRGTVIYFDEAAKEGVMITFRYSGSYEENSNEHS